jgi:hypothetical protein
MRKVSYGQYVRDYFIEKSTEAPLSKAVKGIAEEWTFLGNEYKRLDPDMFIEGLKVSFVGSKDPLYLLHGNAIMIKSVLYKLMNMEVALDAFSAVFDILNHCSDRHIIKSYLDEICNSWTDESSRAELLKKYEIPPRKQIIAAKLAEMNKEVPITSPSLFSEPKPNPGSSPGCDIVPSS